MHEQTRVFRRYNVGLCYTYYGCCMILFRPMLQKQDHYFCACSNSNPLAVKDAKVDERYTRYQYDPAVYQHLSCAFCRCVNDHAAPRLTLSVVPKRREATSASSTLPSKIIFDKS